jgi:hypothetical protein
MNWFRTPFRESRWKSPAIALAAALALVAGAGTARAQQPTAFPSIKAWVEQGAWQDSTAIYTFVPVGYFQGPLPDSVQARPRTLTLRWLRDRVAETRPDFGGYRIYRMVNAPDSTHAVLLRRYSLNDTLHTWHFSRVDSASATFRCAGCANEASDSLATFVDPDSTGRFEKVCRRVDQYGRCASPGDSVLKMVAPPGPHDGFLTWYSITYEKKNTTDTDNEDLFVADTLDSYARCGTPGNPNTCPNLNHKLRNLVGPFEPTGGPVANLERVRVVPNPYRGHETWDQPGQSEMHFINLPSQSTIKIYTVAGDLVRTLKHDDAVRDFEKWDLKSETRKDVASGIYIYRIEAASFEFQNRFVVIR